MMGVGLSFPNGLLQGMIALQQGCLYKLQFLISRSRPLLSQVYPQGMKVTFQKKKYLSAVCQSAGGKDSSRGTNQLIRQR